jgi:hypothetical protein
MESCPVKESAKGSSTDDLRDPVEDVVESAGPSREIIGIDVWEG